MKEVAQTFKALADENRLRILQILGVEKLCACDILENLDLSQPTLSHHLKILQQAGLVEVEKRGKWSYYNLSNQGIDQAKRLLSVWGIRKPMAK